MKFADICGQQGIKNHLQNAISRGKFSHAYIISGEKDSGKMMLAEAFAATILCENQGQDACGECLSCKQASNHNHPDIHYVTHEKPRIISIDDIRGQVNADIVIKPYASQYKIYIIDEAEKMNPQAQNAILKTIEEPPEYAIIFLLTTNAEAFLPTILSRCVTLQMQPINADLLKERLMQQGIPDYQAEVCIAFAQGNFGKAVKLASSEEFNEMKFHMVSLLRRMNQMGVFEISQVVKELNDYKDQIDDYLDLMTIWYKDVLLYKATERDSEITFRDEALIIKKQARECSYQGLHEILEAISQARTRKKANVRFDLVINLLLLKIKENIE